MEKTTFIVKEVLPLQQGTSQRGNWSSQQIIVEAKENVQYPDTLLLTFTNSHVDKLRDIKVGMEVTANWSANVRKFQGKDGKTYYYQELRCWKISPVVQTF